MSVQAEENRAKQHDYYFYAAQQHLVLGEWQEALSCLVLCEGLEPKNAKVKEQIGIIYEAIEQKGVAYHYYEQAYRLDTACWRRYLVMERAFRLEKNDAQGALKVQDEIDKRQGRDRYSVFLRMRIGELTGMKWKQLRALYEEMLEFDPNNATVLNNYAYGIAIHGGNLQLAEEMAAQALKQDPTNRNYIDTYATILEKRGKRQLAEQFRKML